MHGLHCRLFVIMVVKLSELLYITPHLHRSILAIGLYVMKTADKQSCKLKFAYGRKTARSLRVFNIFWWFRCRWMRKRLALRTQQLSSKNIKISKSYHRKTEGWALNYFTQFILYVFKISAIRKHWTVDSPLSFQSLSALTLRMVLLTRVIRSEDKPGSCAVLPAHCF